MKTLISRLSNLEYRNVLLCNIKTRVYGVFCAKCSTNQNFRKHNSISNYRWHDCQMRFKFSKLNNKPETLFCHKSITNYLLNQNRPISIWSFSKQNEWNKALSEAEKIVGYPTSLMSLRCLLSDEIANVAVEMRKLVGTKHPLLKTARGLVTDGKFGMQTRGLMVLLLSKAAGPGYPTSESSQHQQTSSEMATGIYSSQRTLAEIVEMIHTATVIHKGVVNLVDLTPADGPIKDMEFGNKMAVLSGDYLLASACTGLAELHNTKVVEVISSAIAEMMEAEFTEFKDTHGNPKQLLDITFADWLHHTYLSSGSLLAKSCQAALELANHDEEMQKLASEFGENMAYAYQLSRELKAFHATDEHPLDASTLVSAPVIHHLEHCSDEQKHVFAACTNSTMDIKQMLVTVSRSSSVDDCKEICKKYGENALDCLKDLPNSEAKSALRNIVNAVTMAQ